MPMPRADVRAVAGLQRRGGRPRRARGGSDSGSLVCGLLGSALLL